MPGKRLRDPSLIRTTFEEVVNNNGEILTDWEVNNPSNQLVWARPIPLKLVGNAWWQGSYDGIIYSNTVENDHAYARLSTDGGVTWLVFQMSDCDGSGGDQHPPVTIGVPDGGLSISGNDTQVLTLNPSNSTNAGSMSSSHYTKLSNLKFDYLDNVGAGVGIFKDYTDSGDDRTHHLKTLTSSDGSIVFTEGTDSIDLVATGAGGGVDNTAVNYGTDGVGPYDSKSGVELRFRNLASLHAGLTITLDIVDHDIDFDLVESNIDHDLLQNFVTNEHIDHSAVSILTQEGITGGGDLTSTRTLTLSFDTLGVQTSIGDTDLFAFYRNSGGEDLHYAITYNDIKEEIKAYTDIYYVPLTTGVFTTTGLDGGGVLNQNRFISLAFNELPTVPYDASDYVAIYDVSGSTHAKVTLSDIIGELAVSISAGAGMDFTTITSTGPVTLGTPTTLTKTTTDSVSGTTHEHEVDLSTWDLQDLGNVDAPVDTYYIYYDIGTNTFKFGDPAIGASSPGAPVNSIQFNNAGSFGGNAGLLYDPTEDAIFFSDINTNGGATLYFGEDVNNPFIYVNNNGTVLVTDNTTIANGKLLYTASQIGLGNNNIVSIADVFLSIKDENVTPFDIVLDVTDTNDSTLLQLDQDGDFYLPQLSSATTSNVLYFDSATGRITYGATPAGAGGISTLIADSLSGLMVNGGSTSSASSIELDQNDNKLVVATPEVNDYIGFYDVSTGLQSKTLMSFLPGWSAYLNGVLQEEIGPGDTFNFAAGTGINLTYTAGTNTLTVESTVALTNSLDWIEFEFGDFTAGTDREYTLDIKALVDYTILSIILEVDGGTFTDVDLKINGIDVTGCVSMTATTYPSYTEYVATAANSVVEGDRVVMTLGTTYTETPTFIRGKLNIQRG